MMKQKEQKAEKEGKSEAKKEILLLLIKARIHWLLYSTLVWPAQPQARAQAQAHPFETHTHMCVQSVFVYCLSLSTALTKLLHVMLSLWMLPNPFLLFPFLLNPIPLQLCLSSTIATRALTLFVYYFGRLMCSRSAPSLLRGIYGMYILQAYSQTLYVSTYHRIRLHAFCLSRAQTLMPPRHATLCHTVLCWWFCTAQQLISSCSVKYTFPVGFVAILCLSNEFFVPPSSSTPFNLSACTGYQKSGYISYYPCRGYMQF